MRLEIKDGDYRGAGASGSNMDEFVTRRNIEHYRKAVATECDPDRRNLVSRLLAEEEAKLAASGDRPPADADESVSHLNLRYYRKRLETETDLVIRQILIRLIAEEEATMALPDFQKACVVVGLMVSRSSV